MNETRALWETAAPSPIPIPADQVEYLLSTAARAPSIHNSQPWRFRVRPHTIELLADPTRKVRVDAVGREMLLSCGAALYGLRLAIRSLGYRPIVQLLPDRSQLRLVARVRLAGGSPVTDIERMMLEALPHRHTHRGAFSAEPLPPGLLVALQHDAVAERATLAILQRRIDYERLADLLSATGPRQDLDPVARAEIARWSRESASTARDGIPGRAFYARPPVETGRLRQRDFDLGRGIGRDEAGGGPPAATAVLLTLRDGRADWIRAGQALQRLLLRAATVWVSASLFTQPLESAEIRSLVANRLTLPGHPQVLLQFGVVTSTESTSRRPPSELMES
jgi:hypothetical protein